MAWPQRDHDTVDGQLSETRSRASTRRGHGLSKSTASTIEVDHKLLLSASLGASLKWWGWSLPAARDGTAEDLDGRLAIPTPSTPTPIEAVSAASSEVCDLGVTSRSPSFNSEGSGDVIDAVAATTPERVSGKRIRGETPKNPCPLPIVPAIHRDGEMVTWARSTVRPHSAPGGSESLCSPSVTSASSRPCNLRRGGRGVSQGSLRSHSSVRSNPAMCMGATNDPMATSCNRFRSASSPNSMASIGSVRLRRASDHARTTTAMARQLTRWHDFMRHEPVPGLVSEAFGHQHPARQELDSALARGRQVRTWKPPKSAASAGRWDKSQFHPGKRDGFDFWRDLKMPFYVQRVEQKATELYNVFYYCSLSFCGDHLQRHGLQRDGMVYESRIHGMAEVFIPDKAERPELLSWGCPALEMEHANWWAGPSAGLSAPCMVLLNGSMARSEVL